MYGGYNKNNINNEIDHNMATLYIYMPFQFLYNIFVYMHIK